MGDFDSMTPEEAAEYQRLNCVFCKIVKGEIPSRKVFEDDRLICILDIFPSAKGHILMLTKEHFPFLPVIPIPLASHMFRITRGMAKAVKSSMVVDKSTIFIANGALAGQQSPHFLYHIVPRDSNDGLDCFTVPSNEAKPGELEQLAPQISKRIAALLHGSGINIAQSPARQESSNVDLAQEIYRNPQLKELIMADPDGLKQQMEKNPALKSMFKGVDIDKLSAALRQIKEN